MDFSKDTKG